jgi:hypothetical protein
MARCSYYFVRPHPPVRARSGNRSRDNGAAYWRRIVRQRYRWKRRDRTHVLRLCFHVVQLDRWPPRDELHGPQTRPCEWLEWLQKNRPRTRCGGFARSHSVPDIPYVTCTCCHGVREHSRSAMKPLGTGGGGNDHSPRINIRAVGNDGQQLRTDTISVRITEVRVFRFEKCPARLATHRKLRFELPVVTRWGFCRRTIAINATG